MMTIARNLALGDGMSTADGTIPTNGTQPFCTFLWAIIYWLIDGDKFWGVVLIQLVEIVISMVTAYAIFRLGRCALAQYRNGASWSALMATVWFASPLCTSHAMNCLETGTYALVVVLIIHLFVSGWRDPHEPWSLSRCAALGALGGLAFWVRNDACFLVLAICLARWVEGLGRPRDILIRRSIEAVVMGLIALAVAMPWILYNRIYFDHFMPTSGVAYLLSSIGEDLKLIPVELFAYLLGVFPIIGQYFRPGAMIVLSTIVVALVVVVVIREIYFKAGTRMRAFVRVVGLYTIGLGVFYGVFFGAAHFTSRYLFPLAPFALLVSARFAFLVYYEIRRQAGRTVASLAPIGLVVLVSVLCVDAYKHGRETVYFQFVTWVRDNTTKQTWVGAGQSGTLGYFHDRTINLDGKVNPEALRARLNDRFPEYIVATKAQYLVDWNDNIARVYLLPILQKHFKIEVMSEPLRLGVLRRITPRNPRTLEPNPSRP